MEGVAAFEPIDLKTVLDNNTRPEASTRSDSPKENYRSPVSNRYLRKRDGSDPGSRKMKVEGFD